MNPIRPKFEAPFGTTWSNNGLYYPSDGGGASIDLALQQLFVNLETSFPNVSSQMVCLNIWVVFDSSMGNFRASGLWIMADATQNWEVFASINTP